MPFRARLLFALTLLCWGQAAWSSETLQGPNVKVHWLAPEVFGPETKHIAIHFEIEPGWHIYWRNPGDSGAAPKFDLQSEGATLGPILWPLPKRIPFGELVNIGYEVSAAFPFTIDTGEVNSVEVVASLEWLVCKIECIPGFGELKLQRPVGPSEKWNSESQKLLATSLSRIPAPQAPSNVQVLKLEVQDASRLQLGLGGLTGKKEDIQIFPVNGEYFSPKAPLASAIDAGILFEFNLSAGRARPETLAFVILDNDRLFELQYSFQQNSAATDIFSLLMILPLAFLGGVILNLMPCVFPVLSLKVLSISRHAHSRSELVRGVLLYTGGVLLSFILLGAALLLLRSAGSAVGWGFQLQSPIVILSLVVLFWLMSLNFLGFFHFGDSVMNWAGRFQGKNSDFSTGVLAVLVATPCTGPFMGTALGAAAVLPTLPALGIFFALGLGLSAPVIALALFPQLLKKMPRPGAWMETFKQFLGFPLLATALWLLWVLGEQIGTSGWTIATTLLLLLTFSIWLGRSSSSRIKMTLAWALALLSFALALHQIRGAARNETVVMAASSSEWTRFNSEQILEARQKNLPVFIDFTAAWCITCQWNKKFVLETAEVKALFQEKNVRLFRADWTNYDEEITRALAEFNRNSIPVYVYYPPNKKAQLLPQLLSPSILTEYINPNSGGHP